MRKKILLLFFLLLVPLGIKAEGIDISSTGSINITYKYGNNSITDADIYIYKVANVDANGKYTYLDNYNISEGFDNMTASKWNDLAISVSEYIKDNNINYDNTCKTDSNGVCKINNLGVGLYLIVAEEKEIDNYRYTTSPSFVAIPNYNDIDNSYIYDNDVALKTESKLINPESDVTNEDNKDNKDNKDNNGNNNNSNNSNKNVSNVPMTIDNVYNYVVVFVISLFIIVFICIYIKKVRKKEKNNEKNN